MDIPGGQSSIFMMNCSNRHLIIFWSDMNRGRPTPRTDMPGRQGRWGYASVTSGPGATNTVTGIATAYMDSIPMVIVTGQGPPFYRHRCLSGRWISPESPAPARNTISLVRHIDELANTVREAFYCRSGRPGPVLIDLSKKDVMRATTEYREPVSPSQGSGAGVSARCRSADRNRSI